MKKIFSRPVFLTASILLIAPVGLSSCATDGTSYNNNRASSYSSGGLSGRSSFGRSYYGDSAYNGGIRGYSRFGGYNRGYGGYGGGFGRGYGGGYSGGFGRGYRGY